MWREYDPMKPLLQRWMPADTVVVHRVAERACELTGKTITSQSDLLHVDGTLLYQAIKPGCEVLGMGPQHEVQKMAWAVQCNVHMLAA